MSLGLSLALAFADKDKYPKVPDGFAEHINWLLFAFFALMALLAWFRSQSVRRAVLALEDPRALAVARIGFAIMTFICFINLEPYWRMLWSDEGIFDLAYAQDKLGRQALRGWEPTGTEHSIRTVANDLIHFRPPLDFYDWWAVVCFIWNKPSLFYIYGSPDFVFGYMVVFFFVLFLYGIGASTRLTGVIAWFMMSGIYNRNALYWEGTDTVYRAFWWILLFAQTGKAWSVDNWFRCWKLRRKGRLEDPKATPAQNAGKEPIYRLTPTWPKWLFMLQLAALYTTTGCVKTGHVWAQGDALYYALNMDHFYRFEWYTQQMSAVFGTNLFRLMTWTTHWWEMCFPVVLIGVSLRFTLRHRNEPWYRAQDVWWRKWGARAVLVGIWALVWRINYLVLPFCLAMKDDVPQDATEALAKIQIVYLYVIPTYVGLWYVLGRWPVPVSKWTRALWDRACAKLKVFAVVQRLGEKANARLPWLKLPHIVIDQEFLRAWTLGRRVWLTLGIMFHGNLIRFMNIWMFPFIMIMTYIGYISGGEVRSLFIRLSTAWRWVPGLKHLRPDGTWLAPAQSPQSVRIRGRKIHDGVVLALGLCGAYLIYAKVFPPDWMEEYGSWVELWLVVIAITAGVFWWLRPTKAELALHRAGGPALAYTPIGRTLAVIAVTYHATCIAVQLWPNYPIFTFRSKVRSTIYHSDYMRGTGCSQSWRMFAPNPPRSNSFMKTVVVEADGDEWDLRNNAFYYRPNPWIINDRMRKMQRRMIGKGKWYLRYWAMYQCREWALKTGELPEAVFVSKLTTRIPTPEQVEKKGPYHPRKLRVSERDVQDFKCKGDGELPLFMKERYGLPITDADRARAEKEEDARARKFDKRRETWDERKDYGRWDVARQERLERERKAQERQEERDKQRELRRGGALERVRPRAEDDAGEGPEPQLEDDGEQDEDEEPMRLRRTPP